MSNIKEIRQQIAILRETKGKENETLDLITLSIPEAEKIQAWEDLANLYFEQHLTYQHLVMNQRLLDTPNQQIIDQNLQKMLSATLEAQKIIEDHNLTQLKGDLHRFLGRAYTYQNQHELAAHEYTLAKTIFEDQKHPRFLEVQGFFCEALVRLGQTESGLTQATSLYESYQTSPLGLELKQSDYKTWAIWRSGIFPRLAAALEELKMPYDKEKIKTYLQESLSFLEQPEPSLNVSNHDFSYRIEEINKIISHLSLLLVGSLTVYSATSAIHLLN